MLNKLINLFLLKRISSVFLLIWFNLYCKDLKQEETTEDINFLDNNKLTLSEKEYPYSSSLVVGTSFGVSRYIKSDINLFYNTNSETELESTGHLMGLKASYNILFANMFFANRLGIFPRFGIEASIFGYNYLTRFCAYLPGNFLYGLGNIFIILFKGFGKISNAMCRRCCIIDTNINYLKFKNDFLRSPEGIFNILLTFEPETSVFEKIKIIPQIGIGPSIVFLKRNSKIDKICLENGDKKDNNIPYYPQLIDIAFSFKTILKVISTNNFLNSFNLEVGYTYNPLLVKNILDITNEESIVDGGLWNFYLSLNYARHFNIGLETVDFFNSCVETTIDKDLLNEDRYNKDIKNKNTMFFDGGIGFGQWVNIDSSYGFTTITRYLCPMLQFSFSMPYFNVKLSKNHYLSFIGVDVNEDLYTVRTNGGGRNIFSKLVNNLSVTYNFINILSDYNGIKFFHKLGVYVPFLTNLISTIEDIGQNPITSYFFSREMIGLTAPNNYIGQNNSLLNFFVGRFCYKFKVYVDLFRLIGFNFKYNTYFYFGGNTIIFNRRNDYFNKNNKFDYEFLKIECVNFGISFKFN